jgi:2-polyprenyl-6-methoxyphenol hydroxylase-like FAD-dependent oxidoreductase
MDAETAVLVVGGSLNGLSAALLLAHRGVPCLVVERHPGTSIQYKFRGISPRSMEIYRSVGIEAEIRARGLTDDRSAYVARMKNLAHAEISWQGIPMAPCSSILTVSWRGGAVMLAETRRTRSTPRLIVCSRRATRDHSRVRPVRREHPPTTRVRG